MDLLELLKASFPSLLSGLTVTLKITLISICIAAVLGLAFGLMSISRSKILKAVGIIYVDIIRGTPVIVRGILYLFWSAKRAGL